MQIHIKSTQQPNMFYPLDTFSLSLRIAQVIIHNVLRRAVLFKRPDYSSYNNK